MALRETPRTLEDADRCNCLRFGEDFQTADADALATELEEVAIDGESWEVLFRCPRCGRRWLRTYPDADYHGGGIPRMTVISEDVARLKLTHMEPSSTEPRDRTPE
jgi:hypothetical protein